MTILYAVRCTFLRIFVQIIYDHALAMKKGRIAICHDILYSVLATRIFICVLIVYFGWFIV